MVTRLATVRWHRPSALSGAGETVAAFAAHIDEADQARARRCGPASAGVVPSHSSHAAPGTLGGTKKPCGSPSARLCRTFAMTSNAAPRGVATTPALEARAIFHPLTPAPTCPRG